MNLIALIESLEAELLEYFMPEEEREEQKALAKKHNLSKKHLDTLKYLFMGKHTHSSSKAVNVKELMRVCDQKCLDDLVGLGMIKGVPNRRNRSVIDSYYATLPGFLMGHAYQRGYLK